MPAGWRSWSRSWIACGPPRRAPCWGIGVGTPGVIDTRTGTIRWAAQPRLAGPAAGPPAHGAHRAAGVRRQRLAGRGARGVRVRDDRAAHPQPGRSGGQGRRRGHRAGCRLYQGDGFGAGETSATWVVDLRRGVPLRPVRLPRDGRGAGTRSCGGMRAGPRGRALQPDGRRAFGGPVHPFRHVRAAFAEDDPAARTAAPAGCARWARASRRRRRPDPPRGAPRQRDPVRRAVAGPTAREEAARRSLGLLAAKVSIDSRAR